jgi:hypothetical protein
VQNGTENAVQQQSVTITDDDATPTVILTAGSLSINETGGAAAITATLSGLSSQSVTVTWATSGSATLTTDYTLSGTIVIAAGALYVSVNLTAVSDAIHEVDETVVIDIV